MTEHAERIRWTSAEIAILRTEVSALLLQGSEHSLLNAVREAQTKLPVNRRRVLYGNANIPKALRNLTNGSSRSTVNGPVLTSAIAVPAKEALKQAQSERKKLERSLDEVRAQQKKLAQSEAELKQKLARITDIEKSIILTLRTIESPETSEALQGKTAISASTPPKQKNILVVGLDTKHETRVGGDFMYRLNLTFDKNGGGDRITRQLDRYDYVVVAGNPSAGTQWITAQVQENRIVRSGGSAVELCDTLRTLAYE